MTEKDPWTEAEQDPWRAFRPSGGATGSKAAVEVSHGHKKLDNLTSELKKDLQAELRQELQSFTSQGADPMMEQRMVQLESGMIELRHQNENFAGWFKDMGSKYQTLTTAVGDIQQATNQQRQDLQHLGNEINKTQTHLQAALTTSLGEVKQELGNEMAKRFDTFEAMLSKRSRMED